jgi:staphyloferrin B synthase
MSEQRGTSLIDPNHNHISDRNWAQQQVIYDFINALLFENLGGICERGKLTFRLPQGLNLPEAALADGEAWFQLLHPLGQEGLFFRACLQKELQPVRMTRLPVWKAWQNESGCWEHTEINAVEVMNWLRSILPQERIEQFPGWDGFMKELETAVRHTALSREGKRTFSHTGDALFSLPSLERIASFRDRPFHPTSRAKTGWSDEDYRRYSPEFGQPFGVDWVAVDRRFLRQGGGEDPAVFADLLLKGADRQRLLNAARKVGAGSNFALLPVHPWQMEHVLPKVYADELQRGVVRPVAKDVGRFRATSSLRTLVPEHREDVHLKLPMGIGSLGALRILPSRYMDNGEKAQAFLEHLIQMDPVLKTRLLLCDETTWCAFQDPDGDPFADKPGHLACQLRRYPGGDEKGDGMWVPMSALAVGDVQEPNPLLEFWLNEAGSETVLPLFRKLCQLFVETALTCACYGVMPEMHGQNVLVLFRKGEPKKLLLRDHDTLRLHVPWVEAAGLKDPGYTVKPGTRNTLILPTPEEMLAYFQTLGIEVNLYAIAEAWSRMFGAEESVFWRQIRDVTAGVLSSLSCRQEVRLTLKQTLFQAKCWPAKWLIGPLLERTGTGGGSMPSGLGNTQNPLRMTTEKTGAR